MSTLTQLAKDGITFYYQPVLSDSKNYRNLFILYPQFNAISFGCALIKQLVVLPTGPLYQLADLKDYQINIGQGPDNGVGDTVVYFVYGPEHELIGKMQFPRADVEHINFPKFVNEVNAFFTNIPKITEALKRVFSTIQGIFTHRGENSPFNLDRLMILREQVKEEEKILIDRFVAALEGKEIPPEHTEESILDNSDLESNTQTNKAWAEREVGQAEVKKLEIENSDIQFNVFRDMSGDFDCDNSYVAIASVDRFHIDQVLLRNDGVNQLKELIEKKLAFIGIAKTPAEAVAIATDKFIGC